MRVFDAWERGEPYERFIGRWSRRVAPLFVSWLGRPSGARWVDVGSGTGSLSAAIVNACSPSSVVGVEPSQGFIDLAEERLAGQATFLQGSATNIPLPASSVDVVVSGLVLNFVSNQQAAVAEMTRVARGGGMVAAYVWDYAERMQLLRYFWDAAVELHSAAGPLDEGTRLPICRPEELRGLFATSALREVEVKAIDIATPFASFEDYWQPFLGGQGPAAAYTMSLADSERSKLRDLLRERLPVAPDGSVELGARAWAVRGTVGRAQAEKG